jgi:prefoldin subunit 4
MMGSGDAVMLNLGNAYFEIEEEEASAFCDDEVTKMQVIVDKLDEEEGGILRQQKVLKAALYGRFGKSINLEDN